MKSLLAAGAVLVLASVPAAARGPQTAASQIPASQPPAQQIPVPQTPAPQSPAPQTAAPGRSPSPAAVSPQPAAVPARTFTAQTGLLFNTVRPERAADFERVIGYLQMALDASSDARRREQARGWRVFKAAEPGPGNTILYVFVLDPAVAGADYGLGGILAEAYPDPAQLQEIWKLYTGAVTGGGSLLNLSPVRPGTIAPVTPSGPVAPNAPVDRPLPPDADPNRR